MKTVGPQISVGRTSELLTYGDDSVLKVLRPGVPRKWALVEYEKTRIVYHAGLPVPEPRGLREHEGRPAIEYEYIAAPTLWDLVVDGASSVECAADILADLHHRITAKATPAGLPPLAERMKAKIDDVPGLPAADRHLAHRLVEQLADGDRLLHGDLHPANVLIASGRPVVIDWFDAASGPPAADIVRTSILIRPRGTTTRTTSGERTAPPHLPGATTAVLGHLHEAYIERVRPIEVCDSSTLVLLEGISALSRLAEKSDLEDKPLLGLWQRARQLGISMSGPVTGV